MRGSILVVDDVAVRGLVVRILRSSVHVVIGATPAGARMRRRTAGPTATADRPVDGGKV